LREDNKVVLDDFITLMQRIASGDELTKNEINGYAEISLFKDGVIL
jgi:altronate hydrolase